MADKHVIDQAHGDGWTCYLGDCVEVVRGLPDNSVHFSIYSPPFSSLYTFSDDPRDMSNNSDDGTFWDHYSYLIRELARVTMPGRHVTTHCMNLPTSKLRDGFIAIRDFRGDIIRAFQAEGFYFHSEVMIRKDPVSAMQRSKSIGLLHKQVVKDSSVSRMAIADYMVTMHKPGDNPEPVEGMFDCYYGEAHGRQEPFVVTAYDDAGKAYQRKAYPGDPAYSVAVWQRYAESVWTDISQSDVLSRKEAREEADEAHISPLQLTPIRRCIDLWTNPGDIVLSPFAGIGSEGYVAIEMGRKFVGVELKRSYWDQAVANLKTARANADTPSLLDMMESKA